MTSMSGSDPRKGDHLHDDRLYAAGPANPEHARHLDQCEDCRATVERARRMSEVWSGMKRSDREIAGARVRFFRRRDRGRAARLTPLGVAIATLCSGVVALAGARLVSAKREVPSTVETARSVRIAAEKTARHEGRPLSSAGQPQAPRVTPVEPPSAAPPSAAELPRTALGQVEATVAEHPATLLRRERVAPRAVAPSEGTESAATASIPAVPSAADAPSPWVVAAAAMRSGEYPVAERAFDQLASSTDPKTRDDARLARAQLWIAEGQPDRARPELASLAGTGASPLVRQRAAEAIQAMGSKVRP